MSSAKTKNICFLSCRDVDNLIVDDHLAIKEMQVQGEYKVSTIAWDDEADWASFDLVVIRTTWDYVPRHAEFLKKLERIAGLTKLLNSPEVVRWNHHKGYLKELEAKGVAIVPTVMFKYPGVISIPSDWKYSKFIIKPAISATAFKTIIVSRAEVETLAFKEMMTEGDWLLQPFLEEITVGEVSLCFFNRQFSHACIKIPKAGDFRVQEEHGGDIQQFTPDAELLELGQDLMDKIPFELLYGRVDLARFEGRYVLMELELIEPSLYFRTNPLAALNFKAGIDKTFTTP
jgi:glutathione synthase/RimK-type ligase-like ATP-grasp enzyme